MIDPTKVPTRPQSPLERLVAVAFPAGLFASAAGGGVMLAFLVAGHVAERTREDREDGFVE